MVTETEVKYWDNGEKSYEWNYKDGKYDGKQYGWHENDKKRYKGNYKDGKIDGKQYYWYDNGTKWYEDNYKDDVLEDHIPQKLLERKHTYYQIVIINGIYIYIEK